ncbi:hypothetical protein SBV1_1140023 [Verrucomicrobia bacterium]|nr:hypothetical protein SBV1_1140023 [Verrucomicrobiota bacterium]
MALFVCQEIVVRALEENIRAIRAIRKISTNFDKFDPAFGKISTISKNLANSPVFSKHLRASRTTRRERGLPPLPGSTQQ